MLASVRDRVGPGWPFPPGAMMSGGGRARRQEAQRSQRVCPPWTSPCVFMNNAPRVRDTVRQVLLHLGHCKAHPPALGTPLCRSRCYSLLMWALGWCWRCTFCMGIWCVCSISVRSGGDSSAAVPCCFPGWHIQLYVRGRQAGEIQKCLERGWPCQLLAFSHFQLGWDRVHNLLRASSHACLGVQIFHLEVERAITQM